MYKISKILAISALFAVLMFALSACSGAAANNGATGAGGGGGGGGDTANSTTSEQATSAKDSDLVISISDITTKANFYPVEIAGTKMEVLAVKASDGSIRTAFNTCQVCYASGSGYYKQEGDMLVCQNCGNQFTMNQVEVEAGGCNPYPIFDENKTVDKTNITISKDFLVQAKTIFGNWKTEY